MSNNEIKKDIHEKRMEEHLAEITKEFRQGFELLEKYPKSVTIFGSSMTQSESECYKQAQEIGRRIATDLKYAVVDGGGPGIMEAASSGAMAAGGKSVGLRIKLARENKPNHSNTDGMNFTYFFARKTMLSFAAEAYVFFPGGFGTFDELFSVLTLIQTNKIPRVPIILFGSHFWNGLKSYMQANMLGPEKRIDPRDMELFKITDSMDEVIETIRQAPVSDWWRNIN